MNNVKGINIFDLANRSQLSDIAKQVTTNCKVTHNANQSIPNATITALAFNTEKFDTDNMHDNVTNNTRITCKTAGKYLIIGQIEFATNTTGNRGCYIRKNGSDIAKFLLPATTASSRISLSTVIDLSINDYVDLTVYQDSGSALDIVGNTEYSPMFTAVRVG